MWPGDASHIAYSEGIFMGYRHYDAKGIEPLFPFGFGLSYGARFEYSDLHVDDGRPLHGAQHGHARGEEVPQVYLGLPDPSPTVRQPPRSLQAFTKIGLQPGESREVTLALDRRAFSDRDVRSNGWAVAPGRYAVEVGASSRDIRLRGSLTRG